MAERCTELARDDQSNVSITGGGEEPRGWEWPWHRAREGTTLSCGHHLGQAARGERGERVSTVIWVLLTCRVQSPSPWCECWRAWCDWRLSRRYSGPPRCCPPSGTGGHKNLTFSRGTAAKQPSQALNDRWHVCNAPRWSRSPPCQTWRARSAPPGVPRPRCPAASAASLHWSRCWWEGLSCAGEKDEGNPWTGSLSINPTRGFSSSSSSVSRPSGGSCPFLELCWWGSPRWTECAGPTKLQNWGSNRFKHQADEEANQIREFCVSSLHRTQLGATMQQFLRASRVNTSTSFTDWAWVI